MIDETSDIARTDTVEYWETCAKEAGSENGGLQFALDYWIAVANVVKRQRDSAEKERDALHAAWGGAAVSAREEWEIVLDHTDVAVRLENDWHGNYAAHTLARLTGVGIAQGPWRGTPAAALRAIGINANPQLEPHNCADEIIALRAERDALRKDADIVRRARARSSFVVEVTPELLTKDAFTAQPLHVMLTDNGDGTHLLTFRESEELHTLRKDAARLDWLEAGHTLPNNVEIRPVAGGYNVDVMHHDGATCHKSSHAETLREAIDAAMEVKPTTGGEDE